MVLICFIHLKPLCQNRNTDAVILDTKAGEIRFTRYLHRLRFPLSSVQILFIYLHFNSSAPFRHSFSAILRELLCVSLRFWKYFEPPVLRWVTI